MIIQTTRINRTGGVGYLARHLLDKLDENDRIEILAGDRAALHDAQALADVKRCRYSVRHLSISPEREMTPADLSSFMRMVDAEFGIGADRPRLVVRHVKKGRSHFHVAVAEVDPETFKVLDCRRDFARLEDLARRYEASHREHVQPTRTERREARIEGFSDVARKRAERVSPDFNRTRLKAAFAAGADAFLAEVKVQGLRITEGDKGAILVDSVGVFVSAANRAVGARKNEFQKFMEGLQNDKLIGSQSEGLRYPREDGTKHHAAAATSEPIGDARRPRQDRAADRIAPPHPRHAAEAGSHVEVRRRQARSPLPALSRRPEELFLHRLGKVDLDDLLRRARELASWIMSVFEPKTKRLTQQIDETRKRKSFAPATAAQPPASSYDYRRRITP
ncbi:relaxase/mobilization nuclease domain-containing protein [Rhizobium redzepovicii]|uniref:relaxase/mobilization nuclease domain-containing protein n=1 Tax=Rhizobium redzepovicii TaxID=2867518 RepID=UPI001C92E67C|nr:relaxase/mobilization nuclease domain-containing protein [Rhizobium redzepovicii]MBY4591955.1 relaxase/mobilization nuclease domain-containing protein [Rhizobium redzepovicii]